MKSSIFQSSAVRTRQAYVMDNPTDLLNFLESLGFNLIRLDNVSNDQEQTYYRSTIQKKTAFHGQYRKDLESTENDRIGLVVTGSHDCQLKLEIYAGLRIGDHILPMITINSLKHTDWSLGELDVQELADQVSAGTAQLVELVENWSNQAVSFGYCLNVWENVNNERFRLFPKTDALIPSISGTKLALFAELVLNCLYGKGTYRNGKNVKKIVHIRRHLQLLDCFMRNLAETE